MPIAIFRCFDLFPETTETDMNIRTKYKAELILTAPTKMLTPELFVLN